MKLFDSHCHLFMEPIIGDIDGVLLRAGNSFVERIMVPAFDRESIDRVIELSSRPGICGAVGLHPWCADEGLEPDELRGSAGKDGVRAIGEIGLDFKIEGADRQAQVDLFRRQLQVAASLDLPVILHCRGAFEEMLEILGSTEFRGTLAGVIHAFSRGTQLAARFLDLGYSLAFGGAVTRPGARRARRSAVFTPIDRILLETDAPSIGMDGLEACRTEPAHVLRVAEAMSDLRHIPAGEIADSTCRNACRLFGIDAHV